MHKQMSQIQSKDWTKMQDYFEWNKKEYAPALKAMEKYKELDFQQMFLEDPALFVFFVRSYAENKNASYDADKFWSLYYQAYQQLKSDGVLDLNLTQDKLQLVKDFEAKLAGPCLISKEDLENTMTVKKKKKEVSVHFDYHEVISLIEQHYGIRVRGIFDVLKHEQNKHLASKYFSIDDYQKFSHISPVDSLEANYISIISEIVTDQIQYIDFWHYMLDSDFSDISNGSIASMWEPESELEVRLEKIINTEKEFKNYISQKIKQVFFKELSQLNNFEPDDGIDFLIEW